MPGLKVEIDDRSGFCFGVVRAIEAAEAALARGKVYSLGDIVHNKVEVQRLERLGMETLEHSRLAEIKDGSTVLIRAHGEPPEVYALARGKGLEIIDATCPVVARLQRVVKQAHERMSREGGRVVLLGKRGHAEVVGLTGQVGGDVTVIEGEEDLGAVDPARPVYLLSQTTQSLELFRRVSERIRAMAEDPAAVTVHDTICRQVANREPHLAEFSRRFDVVVFVSGRKSSNGKVLCGVCRQANPRTYHVEDTADLRTEWFGKAATVGVCGATSTPRWLMERIARAIEELEF